MQTFFTIGAVIPWCSLYATTLGKRKFKLSIGFVLIAFQLICFGGLIGTLI